MRAESLLKGTFFYSIRQIVVMFLQLLSSVLVLKWIDPSTFGIYSTIALVLGVTQILAEGGFGVYLIQKNSLIYDIELAEMVTFQLLLYISIHIVFIVLFCFSSSTDNLIKYLTIILFIIPISIFRSSSYVLLEKDLQFVSIAFIEILETFVYTLFLIILAYFSFGIWSFIIAAFIKSILGCYLIIRRKKWLFKFVLPKFDKNFQRAISFGISFHAPTLLNYLRVAANPIIIGGLLGMKAVGIADRAIFFSGLPLYLIGAVQQKILFPYFSSIQTSTERIKENFVSILYLSAILDKLFYFPLILIAPIVVKQYYPIWDESLPLFYIAIIGNVLFGSLSFSIIPVLNGLGKVKVLTIISIISVSISWLLLYPLISYFGLVGYSFLSLLIWLIGLVPSYFLIKKSLKIVSIFVPLIVPFISFLFSLSCAFFILNLLNNTTLNMFFISFFTMLIYLLILFYLDPNVLKNVVVQKIYLAIKTRIT